MLYSLSTVGDADVALTGRVLLRPSEVCELVKVLPYVLRSWEVEFPGLGVAKTSGGPRLYRQSDLELVRRIKHLVFGEGLTVAGARRTIEGEGGAQPVEPAAISELLDEEVRQRLTVVRQELRSLLELLSAGPAASNDGTAAAMQAGAVTAAASDGGGEAARRRASAGRRPGPQVAAPSRTRTKQAREARTQNGKK